jgi:transcription termination/antitermination protein NusG
MTDLDPADNTTTDEAIPSWLAPTPETPGEVDDTEATELTADEPEAEPGSDAEPEPELASGPELETDADADASPVAVLDEDELLGASADDDEGDDDEPVVVRESPYDRPGNWYVVHTYAGYENKVRSNLESRIASMNMEDRIFECVIPMEDVIEFKNGKKVVVQKKMFPGYLLVRCDLDDDSWRVVRNTPGVTGFVGSGAKPTPLSRREVEGMLHTKDEAVEGVAARKTRPRLEYEVGETVRVKEGPFADFTGAVADIDEDHLKLKVLVNIFGRETPVELEFSQVAKL